MASKIELRRGKRALLVLLALCGALLLGPGGAPSATPATAVLPSGFHDDVVLSGLTNPTALRFASDGRVFVAEKRGLLKVFDGLSDPTPTVVADLRGEVDNYWDRGLLGLALDPAFPASPNLYLLYTYDAPPGQVAPVWNDACPSPPGPNTDGCVVSGKLVRLTLDGDTAIGPPQPLIAGEWCQQYPSHSVGDLAFGPDGKLYVSGGDGASFVFADYGQGGGSPGSPTPQNPCGDPTAAGGALRAQSPRRSSGGAVLNGAILRLDPATGAGAADNPFAASPDANLRRIVAYGLRNPFRFAFRPGTSELWIGDVGWNDWEEIDRLVSPTGPVPNFGWPCYEGLGQQPGYAAAGLTLCSSLYATPGAVTAPYYTYAHQNEVVPGDGCSTSTGSVVSALAFYSGGDYPAAYDGALAFADHSRNCIWTMDAGAGGLPDPGTLQLLERGAANPVDLQAGPGGDLYYVDFDGGTVHRISYSEVPPCPAASLRAEYFNNTSLAGQPALTRCEDAIDHDWGTGSPAPEVNADGFSARWTRSLDLQPGTYSFTATADDGVRVFVDGTPVIDEWHDEAATTYTGTIAVGPGSHQLRVEYYDDVGSAVAQVHWQLETPDAPPAPVIDVPAASRTYAVGDGITFSGHAVDAEDGPLPATALSWTLLVHHCTTPTQCHVHTVQTWDGVAGGTLSAPDHDYPSHLELVLHATDSLGVPATTSVTLQPRTATLSFRTSPSGLTLAFGSATAAAPFSRTVIVGSQGSVSAPATQTLNGHVYHLSGWSDGGAATHNVIAPAAGATYTASYTTALPALPAATALPRIVGVAREGRLLTATAGSWTGAPTRLAYRWLRCSGATATCDAIPSATGVKYRPAAFDVGSRLAILVTATNAAGTTSARSAPTDVVAKAPRGRIRAIPMHHRKARPRRPHPRRR